MRYSSIARRHRVVWRDSDPTPTASVRHVLMVLGFLLALAVFLLPTDGQAFHAPGGHGQLAVQAKPPTAGLPDPRQRVEVRRVAGKDDTLPVSVGIPFPPGALDDPARVHILDAKGRDMPAAVATMLAWHVHGGGIRAVRAQFHAAPGSYYFSIGTPRTSAPGGWAYAEGLQKGRPEALATLTPEWLTASLIAGPQSVAPAAEAYARYVDIQFRWAAALPTKDSTAWLFDRPSTLFKAYVRTGRADYLAAAEASYRWYMAGIKRDGLPVSPDCGGGWLPTGKPCDVKYVYIEPIVLAVGLTGDDSMHDAATVARMADLWNGGGWNGPPGPYKHSQDYFTERLAGLGLIETVAAFELTGDERYRRRIDDRVGWLSAHQRANPDGLGNDGSWRNSWNVHENDAGDGGDVRGASPWMSENIVDGLWHAWLVTGDARIPPMIAAFGRYLERYGWIDLKRLSPSHDWRNECSGPGGQIAWYWSSSQADFDTLANIQESDGWYSDGHNVELGLPVAAAWYFENDPAQAAALKKRFDALASSYSPACAAISDTARRFNWNNRGAGVAQWMMAQPAGAGLAHPAPHTMSAANGMPRSGDASSTGGHR